MKNLISLIIPAYNEAENITQIIDRIENVLADLPYNYEIIIVDDGSTDESISILKAIAEKNKKIYFLEFSRNFGHQLALKAGLDHARGMCAISLDCDLQHPPELIPQMIKKWEDGYDIVYTVRAEDKNLPKSKRSSSNMFYNVLNWLSGMNIEPGTADFRLMDANVVNIFKNFNENEPFIRGLVKWLGFKQVSINYEPAARFAGTSKYTLKKMINLALHGVTSFSIKPLYMAVYIGFLFSICSILYIPYVIYSLIAGEEVLGWASTIMTIVFFGGLQLLILGIIGIYIGKMFMQTKNRPSYIIRSNNLY